MSKIEKQMNESPLPPEKIERNIAKLAQAVERLYGGVGSLVWRNFLAGFSRTLGLIVVYLLFITVGIFIASRTGAFQAMQNFWRDVSQNLPLRDLRQLPNLDPALLNELENGGSAIPADFTPTPSP